MNQIVKFLLVCSFSFVCFSNIRAQSEPDSLLTLEQRYTEILKKSENFKEYEVVRRSSLNLFWAALNDSVTSSNAALKAALVSKMELQSTLNELETRLTEAETKLADFEGEGAKVSVLGMQLNRSFYLTLLWSLILALAGLMGFFLLRFQKNNVVVKETQDEHQGLKKQFDELRHKSKETQMRLKRELQTALNRLETVERG